ncbi:MAG: protein kinase, partial [Isosphaeraceae bacterium]
MMLTNGASEHAGASSGDPVLAEWVEELSARFEAGERVDLSAYVRRHPERAEQLRGLLPAIAMLAELGRSRAKRDQVRLEETDSTDTDEPPAGRPSRILDDFEIVREVGRGGMGVVFEARQVSLDRRVALKVLPFAAALDPQRLARFRTEAHVSAKLHHSNIVPVYAIGCAEGVHYYAMQFIDGQSLAQLIADLCEASPPPGSATPPRPCSGDRYGTRALAGSWRSRAHVRA